MQLIYTNTRRDEFFLLLITCLLTLFVGISEGILDWGITIFTAYGDSNIKATLCRVGQGFWNKLLQKCFSRFETDTKVDDDVLIIRFDAQLFFGNREYFRKIVFTEEGKRNPI